MISTCTVGLLCPQSPKYLQMAVAHRQSVVLRFLGDHHQSDLIIEEVLSNLRPPYSDIREHCMYGRLLFSRTENAILRKDFDRARSYLEEWEAKNDLPSQLEIQLIRLKNTVFGRVSRYQGDFKHAQECFEACLKAMRPSDTNRYHVVHHLADVYCELGFAVKAAALLTTEFEILKSEGKQSSKAFRRLLLPMAEASIERGMLDEAETALQEVADTCNRIVNPDISDQLGHVRAAIGLGRVAYYQSRMLDARQSLEKALQLVRRYATFSEGIFYVGVIYLFLAVVNLELCNYQGNGEALICAESILSKEQPRFFIPGIGTYFLHHLRCKVTTLLGR